MTDITQKFDPITAVTGPQLPVSMNHLSQADAFISVYDAAGTADYGVEFTPDDVNDLDVTPRWFELPDIPLGSSGTKYASFSTPCRFVRLNLSFLTGKVEFKVLQTVEARC